MARLTAPVLVVLPMLTGCASLPISGPTGAEIVHQAKDAKAALPFEVVEITSLAMLPAPDPLPPLATATTTAPTDLIGAGDVLDIQIYEAGVALFSGSRAAATNAAVAAAAGGTQAEHLPVLRVDDAGRIQVPFVGTLRAAGHTTGELAEMIRHALHGLSQNPQVAVRIAESISGTLIIGGEVAKPGRLPLAATHETLSDVVALAGGYRGEAKDLAARVTRGGATYSYRLADVLSGPTRDMEVSPGDRIAVVRVPQSYAVMGAPGRVEQLPFTGPAMTLAEALANAGGARADLGDAKAVFVFRFVPGADGTAQPVVYHINMMRAGNYFLAQRFVMRDKDVLYVGNAASNQPSKLIQLISQLFSPIVAVQSGLVSANVIK